MRPGAPLSHSPSSSEVGVRVHFVVQWYFFLSLERETTLPKIHELLPCFYDGENGLIILQLHLH